MSQQYVYDTAFLEIHIKTKRNRWNFKLFIGNRMSPQCVYASTAQEIHKHSKRKRWDFRNTVGN